MAHFKTVFNSSVGKKFLQAITGLALFTFVIAHLIGNLLLLLGPYAFNHYAHFLEELGHGMAVPLADLGLLLFFVVHAVTGIRVWLDSRRARPHDYAVRGNAGRPSRKSLASVSMVITGILLLIFVPLHLANFKYATYPAFQAPWFGPEENGVRDLYMIVEHLYSSTGWTVFYVVVMAALGFHLWHGVWSAFQSLGLNHPRWMPIIRALGYGLAFLLAVGFIYLPLYMHFNQRNLEVPPAQTAPVGGPQF